MYIFLHVLKSELTSRNRTIPAVGARPLQLQLRRRPGQLGRSLARASPRSCMLGRGSLQQSKSPKISLTTKTIMFVGSYSTALYRTYRGPTKMMVWVVEGRPQILGLLLGRPPKKKNHQIRETATLSRSKRGLGPTQRGFGSPRPPNYPVMKPT